MRTRYNYGGRYSYGGRYKNGGALNALMKKYEYGGPVIEDVSDLLTALEGVKTPEDYTEQEFIDVRGVPKVGGEGQGFRKFGYSTEGEDVAQPMEFMIRSVAGQRGGTSETSGRGFEDLTIENVQLGGVDEETGAIVPNVITLPAEFMDRIEEGRIDEKDVISALSPYYSRATEQGARTRPVLQRGVEPEEEERTTPPRPRGGKTRQLPQIRFPQIGYKTSPKYAGGNRPLFKKGQLGRVGRGG